MASSRKLAAILFTDIVGYTAMMQQNEENAVRVIKHYVTVLKEAVAKYSGEVLNDYGDGSLCVFSSVTEAVRCALLIQKQLQTEPKVPLRIGLHIGEIFFEDGKILGDGVNVASRIQSLGQANTILFSGEICSKIRNNPEFKTVSLGYFNFKNVEGRIEVFALANEELVIPKREQMSGKLSEVNEPKKYRYGKILLFTLVVSLSLIATALLVSNNASRPDEVVDKSIAVLPFVNMSDDPKQDYFANGMMDEILNHLFKIGDLNVISRTSAMTYKGTTKSSKEIAEELGVSNLLEGSVQKEGGHIRIIIQLIDAKNDHHLWAETYDRELKDVFFIQSDIAKQVAHALKLKLDTSVNTRIEHVPTKNLSAYNLYLEGVADFFNDKLQHSKAAMEQAIALDSSFADPYSWLGVIWLNFGANEGHLSEKEVLTKARPLLQKALKLNPDLASAHLFVAFMELWYNWDFKVAEREYKKVLELNPSNTMYMVNFSDYLNATGKHQEALQITLDALKKDKNHIDNWKFIALNYFYNNDFEKADNMITTASSLFSKENMLWYYLKIKIYLGKFNDAIIFFEKIDTSIKESFYPTKLAYIGIAYYKIGKKGITERVLEILKEKATKSSIGSPSFSIAAVYVAMGQNNEAIKWLEKAYSDHEVEMYWLKVEPLFRPLHNDKRFQSILEKIGFPVHSSS